MKKLSELYNVDSDIEIKGIKINSKEVKPGDLFICTKGVTADRHDFIDDAIENGAAALVVSRSDIKKDIPVIVVNNTNDELPKLCSRFYDYPDKKMTMIGVTGTNGKTTVAEIIQDLLGNDICGYIGTNGASCLKFNEKTNNTSPDVNVLFPYLTKFQKSGCQYVSMEASSEAFYRGRLKNMEFDIAILTNITQDHLNIHKTLDNYIDCKCRLFRQTKKTGFCILNRDDNYYDIVSSCCKGKILTYGKNSLSDVRILSFEEFIDKTVIKFEYNQNSYLVESPLLGEFNVYNLMAAILTLIGLDYKMEGILKRINNIKSVLGRVELVDFNQDYKIVLDYAHTPDALNKILTFLNKVKTNRIITVTGSAGGREQEKRGEMGKIVLEKSDYVIFTMDDPRSEDVNHIIDDLIGNSKSTNFERVISRGDAIRKALDIALKDDIILITGKGRDNYMAIGSEYLPYCDYSEIAKYFNNK